MANSAVIIKLPNTLYPFRSGDVLDFEFDRYRLINVHGHIPPDQRRMCVAMWLKAGVLNSREQA